MENMSRDRFLVLARNNEPACGVRLERPMFSVIFVILADKSRGYDIRLVQSWTAEGLKL